MSCERQEANNTQNKVNNKAQKQNSGQNIWLDFFQQSINSQQQQRCKLVNLIWNDERNCIDLNNGQSSVCNSQQFTIYKQLNPIQQQIIKSSEIKNFNSLKNSCSYTNSKCKQQKKQQEKSKALRLFIKSKLNFQNTYGQKLQITDQDLIQEKLAQKQEKLKTFSTLKQELIFSRYNMYQKRQKFIFIDTKQQANIDNKKRNSQNRIKNSSGLNTKNNDTLKKDKHKRDNCKFNLFQTKISGLLQTKNIGYAQNIKKQDSHSKDRIVTKIYGQAHSKKCNLAINKRRKMNQHQNYIQKLETHENNIIQIVPSSTIKKQAKINIINPRAIILKRDSVSQNYKISNQIIIKRNKQFKNPLLMKTQSQKQKRIIIRERSVQCQKKSIKYPLLQNLNKQKLQTEQNSQQTKQQKFQLTIEKQGNLLQMAQTTKNEYKSVEVQSKIQEKFKFKFEKQTKQYYQAMERFNVKQGYAPNTFLFIFDSRDNKYIVQNLLQNNWKLNKKNHSQYYILKWVYLPSFSDLKHLKNGQFYNHYMNIHEITSKAYLSKNLKSNMHRFKKIDIYFPKSFDIGKKCQNKQFVHEYQQNVVLILLKKMFLKCFEKKQQYVLSCFSNLLLLQIEILINDSQFQMSLFDKNVNILDFQNFKQKNQQFTFNIQAVILILKFCRYKRKCHQLDQIITFNFLQWNQQEFNKSYQLLQAYSEQENLTEHCPQKQLRKQFYATPSELTIHLIVKEFVFFNKLKNWQIQQKNIQKAAQNNQNIWIVKPGSNARGNGIYLQKDLNLILMSVKGIQSRIVQKYIQKPLIFKQCSDQYLNNTKFDFRQWVLIKSINPLQIYMFSHCYIRLCPQTYNCKNIKNIKSHLTNYSVNKKAFESAKKSVLSLQRFKVQLQFQYKVNWDTFIRPKIQQIIIQSILSCQQKIQSSENGTCFQLLGYDILIDQLFNPWLIEVNMSPACQERTQELQQYLEQMNSQLLKIILPIQYIPNLTVEQDRKHRWQKIFYQNYEFNKKQTDLKLQIIGVNPYQRVKNKANETKNFRKGSPNKKELKCWQQQSRKLQQPINYQNIKNNSLVDNQKQIQSLQMMTYELRNTNAQVDEQSVISNLDKYQSNQDQLQQYFNDYGKDFIGQKNEIEDQIQQNKNNSQKIQQFYNSQSEINFQLMHCNIDVHHFILQSKEANKLLNIISSIYDFNEAQFQAEDNQQGQFKQ